MRLSRDLVFFSGAALSVDGNRTTFPTSTDAYSFLSNVFGANSIPTAGPTATTLASSLYSVQTSWAVDPHKTIDDSFIWSAAARATSAPDVVASMAMNGWKYGEIEQQDWYRKHVPSSVQGDISSYVSVWKSVEKSVLKPTLLSHNNAPDAKCTGMAVAAAAVAGFLGVAVAL